MSDATAKIDARTLKTWAEHTCFEDALDMMWIREACKGRTDDHLTRCHLSRALLAATKESDTFKTENEHLRTELRELGKRLAEARSPVSRGKEW